MMEKMEVQRNRKVKQTCPVCKNTHMLTLHHILPKYIFREIETIERECFLNGNNSYWLCSRCHSKYESSATQLRLRLVKDFNFPTEGLNPFVKNVEYAKVKNLCRFMTGKFSRNAYNYSIYEAYNFVKDFHGKEYVSYDEILKLIKIKDNVPNVHYVNLGEFLIEQVGIGELDRLYRESLLNFLKKRKVKKESRIINKNKKYNKRYKNKQ